MRLCHWVVLLYCQSSSKCGWAFMTDIAGMLVWHLTQHQHINSNTQTLMSYFPLTHSQHHVVCLIPSSLSPAAASHRHVYAQSTSPNMLSHTTLPVCVCLCLCACTPAVLGSRSTKPSCLFPRLSGSPCLSLSLYLPRWQFDLRRWSLQMEEPGPRWREKHRNRAKITFELLVEVQKLFFHCCIYTKKWWRKYLKIRGNTLIFLK